MLLLLFSTGCSAFLYAEIGNCADCHIMEKPLSVWMKDGHRTAANCNDRYHTDEKELKGSVEQIQDRTYDLCNLAMNALMNLISDIKKTKDKGTDISQAQNFRRKARFLLVLPEQRIQPGLMHLRRVQEFSENQLTVPERERIFE